MIKVMKFGGSSVADADAMRRVSGHVVRALANGDRIVVVVSALAQVTNQLTTLSWYSREQGKVNDELLLIVKQRHQLLAQQLIGKSLSAKNTLERVQLWLEQLFGNLKGELNALTEVDHNLDIISEERFSARMAQVLAYGELASSTLLHVFLLLSGVDNLWMDARSLIVTNDHWLQAVPDFDLIKNRVRDQLKGQLEHYTLVVVPGFMGGTVSGQTTLLGREGSDYSAAILAEALEADELQIWSDVDGVMGIDPRYDVAATVLSQLSYSQAGELATWGGKVLYPSTVEPVKRAGIPIGIFNSLIDGPVVAGTCISNQDNEQFWAVGGLLQPLVIRWQGSEDFQQFLAQLSAYNLELRGVFPLSGEFLIIAQDHHKPGGYQSNYRRLVTAYPAVEFSMDWDLVAVMGGSLNLAEQDLVDIAGAWLLPASDLAYSRVALVPRGHLEQILVDLYNRHNNG